MVPGLGEPETGPVGKVILLALTASLNPTLVAATTVMLLLDRPVRLMLGYLLGAYITSITLICVQPMNLFQSSTSAAMKQTNGTTTTTINRETKFDRNFLVSAQAGWALGDFGVRLGLFDNSGGGGVDYRFSDRLRFTGEAFDFGSKRDDKPHIRGFAEYIVRKETPRTPTIFVTSGFDNPLNDKAFTIGAGIRWRDDDLKYLIGSVPVSVCAPSASWPKRMLTLPGGWPRLFTRAATWSAASLVDWALPYSRPLMVTRPWRSWSITLSISTVRALVF